MDRRLRTRPLVEGGSAVYLMEADGTAERRLGPDENDISVSDPVWSQDGEWLAIQTRMAGRAGVFRTLVDGGGWTRVSDLEASGPPAWSPNGEWLAFSSCDDVACGLWVVHPDGSGASRVAEAGVNPTWSSDSQWLTTLAHLSDSWRTTSGSSVWTAPIGAT
mgnify:CR=1 FL=1